MKIIVIASLAYSLINFRGRLIAAMIGDGHEVVVCAPGRDPDIEDKLAAMGATAQDYPTRNVTMIVPYAAGGPTDTVARVLAQAMTKPMGQTVIVENKPSAGGLVGAETVKNAKPDGYTILIHHIGMATP